MDAIFWIVGAIAVVLVLIFLLTSAAAMVIFMGPPDAHDIDIVGPDRKDTSVSGGSAKNTDSKKL
jgi:hypothetical protein